ncbi:hypothetical protein BHE74_00021509 [Ensete ventricosum]|nr:hypothetical protein BHE74_00021509 [Ensete ventricosum]
MLIFTQGSPTSQIIRPNLSIIKKGHKYEAIDSSAMVLVAPCYRRDIQFLWQRGITVVEAMVGKEKGAALVQSTKEGDSSGRGLEVSLFRSPQGRKVEDRNSIDDNDIEGGQQRCLWQRHKRWQQQGKRTLAIEGAVLIPVAAGSVVALAVGGSRAVIGSGGGRWQRAE